MLTNSESFQTTFLTRRQLEVLRLVAEGYSNKMIARELAISPRTVGYHITRCKTKLGAANGPNAVHLAHQFHIL